MDIKLYTTHCPKCKVVEKKLGMKNIDFESIDDNDEVINIGKLYGLSSAPILVVDGNAMDFAEANKWIARA